MTTQQVIAVRQSGAGGANPTGPATVVSLAKGTSATEVLAAIQAALVALGAAGYVAALEVEPGTTLARGDGLIPANDVWVAGA